MSIQATVMADLILWFKKSYFMSDQTYFISNTITVKQISQSQFVEINRKKQKFIILQSGKDGLIWTEVWLGLPQDRRSQDWVVQVGQGLPEGYRSMTGRSSSCSVALPPLLVNRTTWYFPSLTNLELSSILMSSVPTLNTTLMLPLS